MINLLKRVAVAVIFVPLILWLIYKSGWPLLAFFGAVGTIQMWESRRLFGKEVKLAWEIIPVGVAIYFLTGLYGIEYAMYAITGYALFFMSREVFLNRSEDVLKRTAIHMFALFYPALLLGMMYRVTLLDQGNVRLNLLLGLIWVTDTAAYFVGMSFGKHRGIFKVSPKKSLEGFLAGIIFAGIGSWVFSLFIDMSVYRIIVLAIAAGFFGQLGDLIESNFKRDVGIKDSSNFLPGHGGLLDRFDSLIIAAPIYYILSLLVG